LPKFRAYMLGEKETAMTAKKVGGGGGPLLTLGPQPCLKPGKVIGKKEIFPKRLGTTRPAWPVTQELNEKENKGTGPAQQCVARGGGKKIPHGGVNQGGGKIGRAKLGFPKSGWKKNRRGKRRDGPPSIPTFSPSPAQGGGGGGFHPL